MSNPKQSENPARDAITASWEESFAATTEAVRAFAEGVRAAGETARASSYASRTTEGDSTQRVWNHACTAVLDAEKKRPDPDPMVVAAINAVLFLRVDPK